MGSLQVFGRWTVLAEEAVDEVEVLVAYVDAVLL
jgi:hypothetical protein